MTFPRAFNLFARSQIWLVKSNFHRSEERIRLSKRTPATMAIQYARMSQAEKKRPSRRIAWNCQAEGVECRRVVKLEELHGCGDASGEQSYSHNRNDGKKVEMIQ